MSKPITLLDSIHWYQQGLGFNYPVCCVLDFCEGKSTYNGRFAGTGYVPCRSCTAKTEGMSDKQASMLLLKRNIFNIKDQT